MFTHIVHVYREFSSDKYGYERNHHIYGTTSKLEAILLTRRLMASSLKEAKDIVEGTLKYQTKDGLIFDRVEVVG